MGHIRKYEPGTGVGRPKILVKCNRLHMSVAKKEEFDFLKWFFREVKKFHMSEYDIRLLFDRYKKETGKSAPKGYREED